MNVREAAFRSLIAVCKTVLTAILSCRKQFKKKNLRIGTDVFIRNSYTEPCVR